jgi:hypothetical protein
MIVLALLDTATNGHDFVAIIILKLKLSPNIGKVMILPLQKENNLSFPHASGIDTKGNDVSSSQVAPPYIVNVTTATNPVKVV